MGARIDSPIARVPSKSRYVQPIYTHQMPPRGRGGSAPPRSTHRGRGAPQQSTCANGLRFSRVVVGQAAGLVRGTSVYGNVPHEGVSRACARTDRPTKWCRRGRWRRPRRRRCRREPAPGRLRQGARAKHRRAVDRGQHSARGSDLPSPGGLPTFRSNRLDRPEPSQHAPLLPATPTTRLGPSASRRPETRKSSARLRVVGAGS